MTYIVKQCCCKECLSCRFYILGVIYAFQMLKNKLHQMRYAKAMSKPRVISTRIGEIADAKLVNTTKALNLRAVYEV